MNLISLLSRFFIITSLIFLSNCSSAVPSIVQTDENNIPKTVPSTAIPKNVPIAGSTMQEINASVYGCKGDGVQLNDFSLSGNVLTSSSASFSSLDTGKTVSIANAGENGEHLLSTIKTIISPNKVLLTNKAASNVLNVMGSYGTDNIRFIQKAVDAAIAQQKTLRFDPGVFLIGDYNINTKTSVIKIAINNPGDNVVIVGSGKHKTIFRELDGKTQRKGRYTKIFYHYLKDSPNVGAIVLSDFSLDKNGRSLTKNPESIYTWEQAHAWSWAGHKNGAEFIDSIHISNIEIVDKIGGGINFSSSGTRVNHFTLEKISESRFKSNTNEVFYAARGDLEISCFSDDIVIKNVDLTYVQLEPVRSKKSTLENNRYCEVTDSSIDTIEYTEDGIEGLGVNVLKMNNITTKNFRNHGVEFLVENSTISAPHTINSINGNFVNCKFLLKYDASENKVKPINATYFRNISSNNSITFSNCEFIIDSELTTIKPKGYALFSSSKISDILINEITVDNCTFDKRLQSSINAYANGKWTIKNSTLAGSSVAIQAGGYEEYYSEVNLSNNNYSQVLDNAKLLNINNHNSLWKVKGSEKNKNFSSRIISKGKVGSLKNQNTLKIN
ncbi:hypothetical protein ULMA_12940 [Patiriisocius marinus]|uniref:Uncharacterized protein n=1 Tax=Patiriisocius marinus TaxID=1397112 RepID=A0A5J4IWF0_9FLAO|nr:hypothetical protein [Patiriisocius marinus]GER59186.1 hypothetical protein ULMA_12940 [Patiriisocius marinus]